MDQILAYAVGMMTQFNVLILDARQMIGIAAALGAALMAASVGWRGTDRVLAWRQRPDED